MSAQGPRDLPSGPAPSARATSGARLGGVRFVVQRTRQYDKQQFPTDDVYYPTLRPTLRLITCGGQFDPADGHYKSNLIVFATARS